MQIKIIAVGKLKEKYWQQAVAEYCKRLSPYAKIQITEVAEERCSDNPGKAEIQRVIDKEGERILKELRPGDYVLPLAIEGKQYSSPELAVNIEKLAVEGRARLAFIIGGSFGLADKVLEQGDLHLSFSALTFPHQMMRVILLEQLYRVFSIINGGKYHK
ncbi:MAG: 23S rRNA (pseudouridine(1915)-N(3))-methyltransferase RlmH [Peptococcia bacterium]